MYYLSWIGCFIEITLKTKFVGFKFQTEDFSFLKLWFFICNDSVYLNVEVNYDIIT